MKRIKMRKWGLILVSILILTNVNPINSYFAVLIGDKSLQYSDYHFSSANPKGFSRWLNNDGLAGLHKDFVAYKQKFPQDSVLYRNFQIQPLKFWRWREYATSSYYDLPYKEIPKEAFEHETGFPDDELEN